MGRKVYKYALTIVDVASCYKEAEPLTSNASPKVARAFYTIYKRSPLRRPKLLQVDPGREFMGEVTQLFGTQTTIKRGIPDLHSSQGIVERLVRTSSQCHYEGFTATLESE